MPDVEQMPDDDSNEGLSESQIDNTDKSGVTFYK
jgi:hypothetical protein